MSANPHFTVRPMNVGAEILGLKLENISDPQVGKDLYEEWLNYGFLVFRDLPVNNDQHITLSNHFGVAEMHPLPAIRSEENPLFMELGNRKPDTAYVFDGKLLTGRVPWHRDTAYTLDICKGAVARVPLRPKTGGVTGFCDGEAAYAGLSEATKARIDNLECKATLKLNPADFKYGMTWKNARVATPEEFPNQRTAVPMSEQDRFPSIVIPMVIAHPETGRKSLYISPTYLDYVIGLSPAESDELLNAIVDHMLEPRFCYRHQWIEGDVVTWDNRRMLHDAEGYNPFDERRLLRTTLAGPLHIGRMFDPATKARAPTLVD